MTHSATSIHLLLRFIGALLIACGAMASPQAASFDFEQLSQLARERSNRPYVVERGKLPTDVLGLGYDRLRDVRFRPARALWRDAQLPFEATFFHLGQDYREPVRIHEIAGGAQQPIPYRRNDFDFGKNTLGQEAWGDLGFAGMRIHYPLNTAQFKDELMVFLGASYFRALGAGQQYGLSARGLAIDTTGGTSGPHGSGEEFPRFTEFWLERPSANAKQLTLYALLESPRVSGAYRFDIRPGAQSVTEVRARIFIRPAAATSNATPIATLGLAPLTSMFYSGENQPRRGDFRPEVHDSDGLLIATGDGEWLWRPLQNPGRPIATSFAAGSLRGFGLMQRDRAFASYEDIEARYERRPSAWVTPRGDWGAGRIELLLLSAPDESVDNVVAYWVPARLPAPGMPLDFAYAIEWQGDQQQRPPGAWATQSRRGMGYSRETESQRAGQVQYVVDFAGPALDALPPEAAVRAIVTTDANARVLEQLVYPNPVTRSWRMTLRVHRPDASRPAELRAFLQYDNQTLSETWSNILLPE